MSYLSTDRFNKRLNDRIIVQPYDRMIDQPYDRIIVQPHDRMIDQPYDQLTDRLIINQLHDRKTIWLYTASSVITLPTNRNSYRKPNDRTPPRYKARIKNSDKDKAVKMMIKIKCK